MRLKLRSEDRPASHHCSEEGYAATGKIFCYSGGMSSVAVSVAGAGEGVERLSLGFLEAEVVGGEVFALDLAVDEAAADGHMDVLFVNLEGEVGDAVVAL